MKRNTKALLIVLCVALLVTGTVVGTLAYLADTDEVVNTFTVGNVDIKLDEADVDTDGQPIDGADRVEGNEYHLIPGRTYVKDPTVTVMKGSEESYVRMKVTINCISQLRAVLGADFLPQNYVAGWDNAVWVYEATTEDTESNTVTYEFRYYKTVDAFEATEDVVLEALFTSFTLPGEITGDQLATIADLQINVVGNAIQVVGFENDEDAAWAAFDAQIGG